MIVYKNETLQSLKFIKITFYKMIDCSCTWVERGRYVKKKYVQSYCCGISKATTVECSVSNFQKKIYFKIKTV